MQQNQQFLVSFFRVLIEGGDLISSRLQGEAQAVEAIDRISAAIQPPFRGRWAIVIGSRPTRGAKSNRQFRAMEK
jgi:hypothetical protein